MSERWDKAVKENADMEREFPVGTIVIHTRTGNHRKVIGHIMSGLKVTQMWGKGSSAAYLAPAEVEKVQNENLCHAKYSASG